MAARYVIRLDDIAENMNWECYYRVKSLFEHYKIKPLIGVIPDNKDPQLMSFPKCPTPFWDEIREVQSQGWEVALHGYQHLYDSDGKNYFGFSGRSEFANHSEAVQFQKLKKGLEIFNREKISCDVFFAPSHTFDRNTIRALKRVGISCISDGYRLYPFFQDGILFVPQILGRPATFPFGLHTSVHHLNEYSERDFDRLKRFLEKAHSQVISFQEARKLVHGDILNSLSGFCFEALLKLKRGAER